MNLIPLGSGLAVATAGYGLYKLTRKHISVKVNCWFCNQNSRVKYSDKNSWNCNSCGQYNGFTSDGDYNKPIQEQFHNPAEFTDVDPTFYAVRQEVEEVPKVEGNGLCHGCNLNQELKVHQLKNFKPSRADRYDEEISEFQAQIERTYRLCRHCEAILHQKLGEQDCWLKPQVLSWKLELNRQSRLSSGKKFKNQDEDVFIRRLTLLFSFALTIGICFSRHLESFSENLPILSHFGFRETISALLISVLTLYGINPWVVINYRSHQASVGAWILLFFYSAFESSLFNLFNLPGDANEQILRSFFAVVCLTISAWTCLKINQSVPVKKGPVIRFESPANAKDFEESDTLTQDLLSTTDNSSTDQKSTDKKSKKQSPLRPPIRPSQLGSALQNHEIHQGQSESPLSFCYEEEVTIPPCDISTLHIDPGTNKSQARTKSPSPFQVRRYDSIDTCGIDFGSGNGSISGKSNKPILRQPKFVFQQSKGIAQSSWVAGGYWQKNLGKNANLMQDSFVENISRSSSQTSGFISYSNENVFGNHLSSLPNSRVNSVCGDRNSVLSEPVYCQNKDMNMQSLGNQLAFFDTTRHTIQEKDDQDSDSIHSILSQSVCSHFKPRAESSPIEPKHGANPVQSNSIFEKKIHFSISISTLVMILSVSLNFGIVCYLVAEKLMFGENEI